MDKNNQIPDFFNRIRRGIESLIREPYLSDSDHQHRADIIHALSSIIFITALASISVLPFLFENIWHGLIGVGSVIFVLIIIRSMLIKDRIRLGAYLFLYFIWILDTVMVIFSGGAHSEYLPSYIAITVMGGLILGGMAVYHFAGISVVAYIVLFVVYSQGYSAPVLLNITPAASIVFFTGNILVVSTVLIMVLRGYEYNFKDLINKEQAISKINLELNQEILSREKTEGLLKQSEDRFRSAVMDSPYPTMLHSDSDEIILMNTAWEKMSGYASEDIIEIQRWIDKAFRENSEQVREKLNQVSKGKHDQAEGLFPIYTRQGDQKSWHFRWARLPQLSDEKNLILTIAMDLTNLLAAETALRESEEQISKISLATNDGIWDWNLMDDTVVFDPHYYTMAGYEVNEFPHHLEEFRRRVHPDDVERVFKTAEDHLLGIIDRFEVEFRFLMKDSNWLWIMGRGKIIEQDADGNPLRFVGTHTDISKRKQAEQELDQYRLQLEQIVEDRTRKLEERIKEVERLNSALTNLLDDYQAANQKLSIVSDSLTETHLELETFTYSISNDLQVPLREVTERTESILKDWKSELNSKAIKSLASIQENAEKIDQHIKNLIQLTEIGRQTLNKTELNPTSIVKDVLKKFTPEINKRKIKVKVDEIPTCLGDEFMIKQVFNNLISNAVKFTKNKRSPRISIGHQPDPEHKGVICFVKDNGIGFDMKDKEKVFETFQRLHSEDDFQGAGIGLAIAKRIISRHGGSIWVEAKDGKGATFYFNLERGVSEEG